MPRPSLTLIRNRILKARNILIAGHAGPDFDCAGSVMALYEILKKKNKTVAVCLKTSDSIWENFRFFKQNDRAKALFCPDLAILVDYGRTECLEKSALEIINKTKPVIVSLDHHPFQNQIGDMVWIDTKKSSVSEMVFDLFKSSEKSWSENVAFSLFLGILGDTGGFAYYPLDKAVAKKISLLAGNHGTTFMKASRTVKTWAKSDFILYAQYLPKLKIDSESGFAHLVIHKVFHTENSLSSAISNQLIFVKGIKIALVLRKLPQGGYKASLRGSYNNTLDLGEVAADFGGGGHFNSSGFKSNLSSVKIIARVKQLISEK
jgi:phosphoesterase RecJ-like protein